MKGTIVPGHTRSNKDITEETQRILHPFTRGVLGRVEGNDMVTKATGLCEGHQHTIFQGLKASISHHHS